jgi:hypothetical protein
MVQDHDSLVIFEQPPSKQFTLQTFLRRLGNIPSGVREGEVEVDLGGGDDVFFDRDDE